MDAYFSLMDVTDKYLTTCLRLSQSMSPMPSASCLKITHALPRFRMTSRSIPNLINSSNFPGCLWNIFAEIRRCNIAERTSVGMGN